MAKSFEEMQLIEQLQRDNLPYDDSKDGIVIVNYSGEHLEDIPCYVSIRKLDSGTVIASISCFEFFSFKNDLNGYLACNKANDDALIARFYIDDDDDAVGFFTDIYTNGFDVQHFVDQMEYFAGDMDDAYPFFAEAKQ